MLDVRAAVEWVWENIEAFGGDPKNIMVSATFPDRFSLSERFFEWSNISYTALGTVSRRRINPLIHSGLLPRPTCGEVWHHLSATLGDNQPYRDGGCLPRLSYGG